ncbi:glycosyltransferase family 4 protein [Desulforhopalus vacuolatus]|uniref:glycosyltransferase family 4 protein n=1 Tax=Desulforhopalus vacuolatus TaxID=40414 RepID=UPI001963FB37|nr:glycosyltransferase family 4 protein [Desulforhopalus vacuolatus]MBM9520184.1 glycosyltransferase family 4 protein [Desulforhopalus vacuolatus]
MKYLPVLFGFHASNLGNSHVPLSLCRWWNETRLSSRLYVPSVDEAHRFPWVIPAARGIKKKLMYRFGDSQSPQKAVIKLFKQKEGDADIVYLWAALPVEVFIFFREKGAKIVIERINCHRRSSRDILRQAYESLGLPDACSISDRDIEQEEEKLALCDGIFCPSPMVSRTMLENNVPGEKLLATSYGWDPARFPERDKRIPRKGRPIFLFVGTLCVRKGVPLLLKAWQEANIDGELILCGGIADEIRQHFGNLLEGKNVRYLPYTKNIGNLYKEADVFVFPTLEEGGPMVTYEAMAHSIPVLVTEMGAGAIARDQQDGLILPDQDISAWVEGLRRMAEDHDLRVYLGEQARVRAGEFTWERTAAQRARLLRDKFPTLWR